MKAVLEDSLSNRMFGGSTTFVTSRSIRNGLRRLWTVTRPHISVIVSRDLSLTPTDKETISRHQLRYDITIIPSLKMGLEFVKRTGTITRV